MVGVGKWLENGACGIPGRPMTAPVLDQQTGGRVCILKENRVSRRIRAEGRGYQERAFAGTGIAALLCPDSAPPQPRPASAPPKRKPEPVKNFARENRSFIRKLERATQKQLRDGGEEKPAWMESSQLLRHKSRSAANLHRAPLPEAGGEKSRRNISAEQLLAAKERLRRVEQDGRVHRAAPVHPEPQTRPQPMKAVPQLALGLTPTAKPSTPNHAIAVLPAPHSAKARPASSHGRGHAKNGYPKKPEGPPKDFVTANVEAAAGAGRLRRAKSLLDIEAAQARKEELLQRHKPGAVPNYLKERKAAAAEVEAGERRAERLRLTGCPPSHRPLSREERLETLESLRQSETELIRRLNSLPVRDDTLFLRRRKAELGAQLADVDAALQLFSKPKVFVKEDMDQDDGWDLTKGLDHVSAKH